jgi:hypothetical protein
MEEHPTPRAQVLHGVGVDICMGVLDALYIALLMFPPLLCKDAGILVRFAFVWAEQEEMGLAGTLGRRYHDIRRDRRLHNNPLDGLEGVAPLMV